VSHWCRAPFPIFFFFLLLFICAYKAWFISPPCPHPLPYHPLLPLPLLLPPTPSIPSRNYFALISNFVVGAPFPILKLSADGTVHHLTTTTKTLAKNTKNKRNCSHCSGYS
jgi:hypothetical protein